ncbi:RICIN domain-containing protein [uncultured Aquimarina sp.]|uniref:RICIN domain-containing protein n=1 Tax=uncultured Aquimarina sp. TaxID=575652 RepID=UPI002624D579|nr:RICIN domain-containing protein [uncultured Aquimarina sp.]
MKTIQLTIKAHYLLLFLFFATINTFSQNWGSGWVYIQNVKTGLVIDVQHDVKANGTNIWPYSINYGRAQMFRFSKNNIPERYGEDARYIMAYNNSSISSDFYLSVKTPPLVIKDNTTKEPSGSGINSPDLVQSPTAEVVASDRPISSKQTARNFVFSIEAKREVDDATIPVIKDLSTSSVQAHKQIWKITPVAGEADTYYIQSAHFDKKMVIEPLDFSSGGTLVMSSFTGNDIQKWRILKTKPKKATDLILSNFEWEENYIRSPLYKPWKWHYVQKIKGKLSWTNSTTSDLTKQYILIDGGSSSDYDPIVLDGNETSYEFDIKSTTSAKTKEHCFTIRGHSKWVAENKIFSDDLCEKPEFKEVAPPTTTPPTTISASKLVVSNCHNDRKSVRLWTYDHTVNDGVWKDHGILNSQWQGSGCPEGSPKDINLTDDHIYTFVAIDCGNSPPNQSQATCHKFTSFQIQGNSKGSSFPINIS